MYLPLGKYFIKQNQCSFCEVATKSVISKKLKLMFSIPKCFQNTKDTM
jgi:hypothetical protein